MVVALHYQPEESGFDSRWCHWNFFIYIILSAAVWHSNRHRPGQKCVPQIFPGEKVDWCLVLTISPPSFADCLAFDFLETYRAVIGMYRGCLTLRSPVRLASVSQLISKLAIRPRGVHTNFLRGQSNSCVRHRKLAA